MSPLNFCAKPILKYLLLFNFYIFKLYYENVQVETITHTEVSRAEAEVLCTGFYIFIMEHICVHSSTTKTKQHKTTQHNKTKHP